MKLPICLVFKMGFSSVEMFHIGDYVNVGEGSVAEGEFMLMGFFGDSVEAGCQGHHLVLQGAGITLPLQEHGFLDK